MSVHAPLASVCAMLLPGFAYGSAPLSVAELQAYCRVFETEPQSDHARLCAHYVRGFVDGLIVAEAGVDPAVQRSESWAERAARTRLGARYQARGLECLDDPVALRALIARVLQKLDTQHAEGSSSARDLVLRVLRERSPCDDERRR
jgi:hypothetical protein